MGAAGVGAFGPAGNDPFHERVRYRADARGDAIAGDAAERRRG